MTGAGMTEAASLTPRTGLIGHWDRLVGPGATRSENLINLLWSFGFAAYVLVAAVTGDRGWNILQLVVVTLVALDLAGGVSVNASASAKRWWHRPGQGFRQHLGFVVAHLHPFVLAALFPAFGWQPAAEMYAYLLAASVIILATPRDVRTPVAFICLAVALVLLTEHWPLLPGLGWFAPFYFLKLLAHLIGPADE